jgi:hypothetical protein
VQVRVLLVKQVLCMAIWLVKVVLDLVLPIKLLLHKLATLVHLKTLMPNMLPSFMEPLKPLLRQTLLELKVLQAQAKAWVANFQECKE